MEKDYEGARQGRQTATATAAKSPNRELWSELATRNQELEAMRNYAQRLCIELGKFAREAARLRERVAKLKRCSKTRRQS